MPDKKLDEQGVDFNEGRVKRKPDLTLLQAVTMSVVAILAVAVGTVYGTILF